MRRTPVVPLVVIFLAFVAACSHQSGSAAGGTSGKHGKHGGAGGPDDIVPVTVAEVKSQDVPIYLDGLGAVLAFNTATLQAQVTGQLISVPFKEGDEVKSGDLIAQIDPRTYQAQLDQALAKKAQDEATLASAKLDSARYQGLVADGYVTQQQVDQQKATVLSDAAIVQSDQAAIESARVELSYCTIRAPFTGVVGIRQVDVGNLVQGNSQTGIVSLTQIKPISVTFTLPEQALGEIRKADTQSLPVIAVNRDNKTPLATGALLAFDNQIDQTTGTIKLKATFANTDRALWPGQFVNARLLVRTQHDGIVIPAQAVQRGPNGAFVYVVKEGGEKTAAAQGQGADQAGTSDAASDVHDTDSDKSSKPHSANGGGQTAEMQVITVAQTEDGLALISDGLKVGDQVITDGQYRLQPGSKVKISTDAGHPDKTPGQTKDPASGAPAASSPAPSS